LRDFIFLVYNTDPGGVVGQKEDHIVDGLRSGRESAYRQLFELYYQKLVVFAMKYLGDLEIARDLVQDLFLSIYESRRSISIQTSLKSYLYSAVKNRCLNHIKHKAVREKHTNTIIHSENGRDQDLEEKINATELEARIFEIVSQLPDKCRQIFIMSRVDGKRNREIADELKLSVRTVETQISKALKTLKDNLLLHWDQ
jgi:RNA polymerase sigma-70 factor (family 1)